MDVLNIVTTTEQITGKIQALALAVDPERRNAALEVIREPFGDAGPYKFAPASELKKVEKKFLAEEDHQASVDLYHLEHATIAEERRLPGLKASAQLPPSAEDAWLERTNQPGLSEQTSLQIETLNEIRTLRLTPELRTLQPSRVHSMYLGALAYPNRQDCATLIRLVEEIHGSGWAGAEVTTDDEIGYAKALREAIGHARFARIPPELRDLEAAIERAKIQIQRAKKLHGLNPINPLFEGPNR